MKDEILIATSNKHKLREISQILGVKVRGEAAGVKEDGKTFEQNAVKKAKYIAEKFKRIAIADDSGLMVDCLGGRPGVRSARFATPPTAENLCNKLLRVMLKKKECNRKAMFVCAIAVASPAGKIRVVTGRCRGKIIEEMRGEQGFGYDPVFVPRGYKKTFAEMKPSMKNRLSHRGKALKALKGLLRPRGLEPPAYWFEARRSIH